MRLISKIINNQEKPVSNSGGEVLTSNPNLLINPWFTVNQRGLASYTPNDSYTVDRWKGTFSADLTVAVNSDGIKLTNSHGSSRRVFIQKIENSSFLDGKTVTGSILFKDGTIISGTVTTASVATTDVSIITFGVNSVLRITKASDGLQHLSIVIGAGESFDIRAVKLEIGSVSTLHLDTAPDYAIELAKCQTSTADPNDTYANQGQLMTSALQGELGAKNLLPFPYYDSTKVWYGVTYTVNSDGSVGLSGTSSGSPSAFELMHNNTSLRQSKYIVSDGGAPSGIGIRIDVYNGNTLVTYADTRFAQGGKMVLDLSSITFTMVNAQISVSNGVDTTGVTVYPMIRDARIQDPTYVPYAMTNRELTKNAGKYKAASIVKEVGIGVINASTDNHIEINETFNDGTRRIIQFTSSGIISKYYNGSTWVTEWTK